MSFWLKFSLDNIILFKMESIMIKMARNSLLARATRATEHCHWITADARNNQT